MLHFSIKAIKVFILLAQLVLLQNTNAGENIVTIFAGRGLPDPFRYEIDASLEDGTSSGALFAPFGIAARYTSDEVYILDLGQIEGGRILKFTATGLSEVIFEDKVLNFKNPQNPIFISTFTVSNNGQISIAFTDNVIRNLKADGTLEPIAGKIDSAVKELVFDNLAIDTVFPSGVKRMRYDIQGNLYLLFSENVIGRIENGVLRKVLGSNNRDSSGNILGAQINLNDAANSILPAIADFDISPLNNDIVFHIFGFDEDVNRGIFKVGGNTITPIAAVLNGNVLGLPLTTKAFDISFLSDGTLLCVGALNKSGTTGVVSIASTFDSISDYCGGGVLFEGPSLSCYFNRFSFLAAGMNNTLFIADDTACSVRRVAAGTLSFDNDGDRDGYADVIEDFSGTLSNSAISNPGRRFDHDSIFNLCLDFKASDKRIKLTLEDAFVFGEFFEGDQVLLIFDDFNLVSFNAINEKQSTSFGNGKSRFTKKKIKYSDGFEYTADLITFDFPNEIGLTPDGSLNITMCYLSQSSSAIIYAYRIPITTKGNTSTLMKVFKKQKTKPVFTVEKPGRRSS